MLKSLACRLVLLTVVSLAAIPVSAQITYDLVRRIDVAPAWSGHPVGFALLTEGDTQFIAFYDAEQNMTLAQRKLDETEWTFNRLPSKIGWDSHNYIAIALDRDKHLHVSGNMHCIPLIYFRSEKPMDIQSLVRIPAMTGDREKRVTYPQFFKGPNDEMIFTYRDGGSGNGSQIWNVYDPDKKSWNRLLDQPMFDGKGKMNAYFKGPLLGPDGFYHVCWMWRDTPDCSTNHDLSYVRSKDLRHWENSRGEPVTLPITIDTGEIVDDSQPKGGLLNPAQHLGFDLQGRVVISYGKYDADGNYQLYHARLEKDGWKRYRTTDWKYRWDFQGGGSIIGEISFGPVEIENGKLTQSYRHIKEGGGRWILDENTFKPLGKAPTAVRMPPGIGKIELDFPKIQGRRAWDIRDQGVDHGPNQTRFVMSWETQPPNRDRPHPTTPPPTMLRVFEIKSKP